jgi:hypothetical protein
VHGEIVVEDGELRTVDSAELARDAKAAHLRMMEAS